MSTTRLAQLTVIAATLTCGCHIDVGDAVADLAGSPAPDLSPSHPVDLGAKRDQAAPSDMAMNMEVTSDMTTPDDLSMPPDMVQLPDMAMITTADVLGARGGDCLKCAMDNGCFDPNQFGGTCDGMPQAAPAACAAVLGIMNPTETDVCLAVLNQVFLTHCAQTLQMAPCLCGNTDVVQCMNGMVIPDGPIYDIYSCDYMTGDGQLITNDFLAQHYGASHANALIECAAGFNCNCGF
jgi:hypothetical protein